MKKIISMLCAATLFASVLMGCGGGGKEEASSDAATAENTSGEDASAEEGKSADGIKVGFVVKSLADQYWILVKAGAEAAAEENGVDLTFIAPNAESDVAKQVENIETLIAAGVDVLCIAPSKP